MSPEFIIALMLSNSLMFLLGNSLGAGYKRPIEIEDINTYINEHFPDRWTAYKQGVHEGYEQGLRDGQDGHEPT